ncbi:MAG TPA: FAD-linked oxidase [Cyanobacteria bacterium UBA8156]|jgi:FAD/FMN-containing dehydrogenase|nr:FAD-linked oxidase [Cyanobacteria bacterium UBA8156]
MTELALALTQAGIPVMRDEERVAKLSGDYYHFSPVLTPLLADKRGDLAVRPTTEAEVLAIARLCVQQRVPVTVRGSGTGNYGQCVPLRGGLILDTSGLQRILRLENGTAVVEPGVKLGTLERAAQEQGWELRMYPSTVRSATVGGFIAGGSGGIGSVTWGQLRDRGNLRSVRVVTLETEPQILTLAGDSVQAVNHAYGTNGILTALEMALAPATPWQETVAVFADFAAAAALGWALARSDGIAKKLISVFESPIPEFFAPLREAVPIGCACLIAGIGWADGDTWRAWVQEAGGTLVWDRPWEGTGALTELTWNHTTLLARSRDAAWTYLQCVYPNLETVAWASRTFAGELYQHLEFMRLQGQPTIGAIPLWRYTTTTRLRAAIAQLEEAGVVVFDPHTYVLEDGGMKTIDRQQADFKQRVDPYGLLNPGKTRAESQSS